MQEQWVLVGLTGQPGSCDHERKRGGKVKSPYGGATAGRPLIPVALAEAKDPLGLVARGERDVSRDIAGGGRSTEHVVQGEEVLVRVDATEDNGVGGALGGLEVPDDGCAAQLGRGRRDACAQALRTLAWRTLEVERPVLRAGDKSSGGQRQKTESEFEQVYDLGWG